MHQTPVTQADGDSRPRFIPPQAKLIGYIVAQPHRLPQFRLIERADCGFCGGTGRIADDLLCTDCRGTGRELRREDHFALDDDDSLDDLAGLKAACHECGAPFSPLNDTDRLCAPCYVWNKT